MNNSFCRSWLSQFGKIFPIRDELIKPPRRIYNGLRLINNLQQFSLLTTQTEYWNFANNQNGKEKLTGYQPI
jgi:hypothetical protein